jgi:hypothetical protein
MERIVIYTSRKKSIFLLLGSIAFVALGIWFLFDADLIASRRGNPLIIRVVGVASILFFALGAFVGLKQLVKTEIALIIDAVGIRLNPKKSRAELIEWKDIQGFKEVKIMSTRILIINVTDSIDWLNKESNSIKRKMMQFNIDNYGSPFSIAVSGLDIGFDELNKKLKSFHMKYKI